MNKKDMETILSALERLCAEYQAMCFLLDYYNPPTQSWRVDLRARMTAPAIRHRNEVRFDEVRANLQQDQWESDTFSRLILELDKVDFHKPFDSPEGAK